MYLRKSHGPRAVTLPDRSVLSLADLPPVNTRWVASRKAIVVNAVRFGLLERGEAIARYGLSDEEFDHWLATVENHGYRALRITAIQRIKQPMIE